MCRRAISALGAREISYMFGQYKRLVNRFVGTLTGKGLAFGGSLVRMEATGYGATYFMQNMLDHVGDGIKDKKVAISGSGNVALYCIEKVLQLGGKVLTASDSQGFVYDPDGIDEEKLAWLKDLKEVRRGRIREYAEHFSKAEFHEDQRPWGVPVDLAFPCATQNELNVDEARELIKNGLQGVAEGANMPSSLEAVHAFLQAKVLFGPAKAANAGGVAVSGLEQSQNAMRLAWPAEEVESRLRDIMKNIHTQCLQYGEENGSVNYVRGANIAGFVKVAEAMLAYGVV